MFESGNQRNKQNKPVSMSCFHNYPGCIKSLGLKPYLLLFCLFLVSGSANAQQIYSLNMEQAIAIAEKQSPDAILAKTKYRGSYWRYRYYRAAYLPALSLAATLPDITKSYSQIILPDGSEVFGIVRGVTDEGALRVETPQGMQIFNAGEISLREA